MKPIKLHANEEFGNTARDILLEKELKKEIADRIAQNKEFKLWYESWGARGFGMEPTDVYGQYKGFLKNKDGIKIPDSDFTIDVVQLPDTFMKDVRLTIAKEQVEEGEAKDVILTFEETKYVKKDDPESTTADTPYVEETETTCRFNLSMFVRGEVTPKLKALEETLNALIATKQETLIDVLDEHCIEPNIKTITVNGEEKSLLVGDDGEETIEIKADLSEYYTKDEVDSLIAEAGVGEYNEIDELRSLNDTVDKGVYKLNNATDVPADTASRGVLHVNKLEDGLVEQIWWSDTNIARRIFETDAPTPALEYKLTVSTDGGEPVEYQSGLTKATIVKLAPGKEHTLSGQLFGQVYIGETAEPVDSNTKIRLNGVNITSHGHAAIEYMPDNKTLTVEVMANTTNLLYTNEAGAPERTSTASLYVNNGDLRLTGTGYLKLVDTHGHATKGSEISLIGCPTVEATCEHDAIHASKWLRMTGGKYIINEANDAFSVGSDTDRTKMTVEMTITGGDIEVKDATSVFEHKSSAAKCKILNTNIKVSDSVTDLIQEENGVKFKFYDSCELICNKTSIQSQFNARKAILADEYEPCRVTFVSIDGTGQKIDPVAGVYALNKKAVEGRYMISGKLDSTTRFIGGSATEDINVELRGVYLDDNSAHNDTLFEYRSVVGGKAAGRLQIDAVSGYINYIRRANGTIFKSNSNFTLNVRSEDATEEEPQHVAVLYLKSNNGTVIHAVDESAGQSGAGRCAIAKDGICYVTDSNIGIRAGNLWIGNEYSKNGVANWKKSDLSLYLMNNVKDAEIVWKNSDLPKKYGYITAPYYLLGTAVIGDKLTFVSADKPYVEAMRGTIDELYKNTAIVHTCYKGAMLESANVSVFDKDYAHTNIEPLRASGGQSETIPEGSRTTAWKVYKAAMDEYVSKTEYDAKVSELSSDIAKLQEEQESLTADILSLVHRVEALERKVKPDPAPSLNPQFDESTHDLSLEEVEFENNELKLGSLAEFENNLLHLE